ncbi:MAG: hypothetical protein HQK50_06245 [Oligoflexia bacterium]|nr:hypothetical protein [Oligoflexia bacterium]
MSCFLKDLLLVLLSVILWGNQIQSSLAGGMTNDQCVQKWKEAFHFCDGVSPNEAKECDEWLGDNASAGAALDANGTGDQAATIIASIMLALVTAYFSARAFWKSGHQVADAIFMVEAGIILLTGIAIIVIDQTNKSAMESKAEESKKATDQIVFLKKQQEMLKVAEDGLNRKLILYATSLGLLTTVIAIALIFMVLSSGGSEVFTGAGPSQWRENPDGFINRPKSLIPTIANAILNLMISDANSFVPFLKASESDIFSFLCVAMVVLYMAILGALLGLTVKALNKVKARERVVNTVAKSLPSTGQGQSESTALLFYDPCEEPSPASSPTAGPTPDPDPNPNPSPTGSPIGNLWKKFFSQLLSDVLANMEPAQKIASQSSLQPTITLSQREIYQLIKSDSSIGNAKFETPIPPGMISDPIPTLSQLLQGYNHHSSRMKVNLDLIMAIPMFKSALSPKDKKRLYSLVPDSQGSVILQVPNKHEMSALFKKLKAIESIDARKNKNRAQPLLTEIHKKRIALIRKIAQEYQNQLNKMSPEERKKWQPKEAYEETFDPGTTASLDKTNIPNSRVPSSISSDSAVEVNQNMRQEEIAYEFSVSINKNSEKSIWSIISERYKKSVYPSFYHLHQSP